MHWDLANKKLRTHPASIFLRPVQHLYNDGRCKEPDKATTRYAPRIVLLLSELCLCIFFVFGEISAKAEGPRSGGPPFAWI